MNAQLQQRRLTTYKVVDFCFIWSGQALFFPLAYIATAFLLDLDDLGSPLNVALFWGAVMALIFGYLAYTRRYEFERPSPALVIWRGLPTMLGVPAAMFALGTWILPYVQNPANGLDWLYPAVFGFWLVTCGATWILE